MDDDRKEKLRQLDDEEKNVRNIVLFFLTVIGLFFLSVFIYGRFFADRYADVDLNTSLKGYISDVNFQRGVISLKLENGERYIIATTLAENLNYQPPVLGSFLTSSDWIEKRAGSDTIRIMRRHSLKRFEKYIFVLGKTIEKD